MTRRSEPPGAPEAGDDDVVQALVELKATLDDTISGLTAAAERIGPMIEQRISGKPWSGIAVSEQQPVITEIITQALDELGDTGSRFRRAKATALRQEGLSMRTIGELLGVSRQRVWTLLHGPARPTSMQSPSQR
ncbi:helix-turn-helix domain-containing protein [Pseudonocardia sp. DLS-67]